MNVSGHRISTTEVEIGARRPPGGGRGRGGRAPTTPSPARRSSATSSSRAATTPSDELGEEIRQHVAKKLGPIARPKAVIFTDDCPRPASGKIMRRLLRDVAEGRALGDTTTLADPGVVEEIQRRAVESPTED